MTHDHKEKTIIVTPNDGNNLTKLNYGIIVNLTTLQSSSRWEFKILEVSLGIDPLTSPEAAEMRPDQAVDAYTCYVCRVWSRKLSPNTTYTFLSG